MSEQSSLSLFLLLLFLPLLLVLMMPVIFFWIMWKLNEMLD
jgi:hypothetical protein